MNPRIVICGDLMLEPGNGERGNPGSSRHARGHGAHPIKTVECGGATASSTIYGPFSSTVWRAVEGPSILTHDRLKSARRRNSGRPFGAGNLSRPLVKPAKQPSGCLFKCFEVLLSLFAHVVNGSRRSFGCGVEEGQENVRV